MSELKKPQIYICFLYKLHSYLNNCNLYYFNDINIFKKLITTGIYK